MRYLGFVLIGFGYVLIPIILLSYINTFTVKNDSNDLAYLAGYHMGGLLFVLIMGWLDYKLIKFGYKLKNKKQ